MNKQFPFVSHDGPIAIAHRGGNAAGVGKENTMAAFQAAYKLGYRYFETDVVVAASGEVILYHGLRSNRKARNAGWEPRQELQTMSLHQIRAQLSIDGEPIPTLEELLSSFPDVFINIDPKTVQVVQPLGELLHHRKEGSRVCIGSAVYSRTTKVANILGGQANVCTVLTSGNALVARSILRLSASPLKRHLAHTKAACLELPQYLISHKLIRVAQESGLNVYAWTVNERQQMEHLLNLGIDGIMTDEVALLQRVMKDRSM